MGIKALFYKGERIPFPGGSSTDEMVKQTATTADAEYEILLSGTADNTTRTEGAKKNTSIKHNPSTGNTTITGNYNDVNGKLAHKPLTQDQYSNLSQAEQLDGTEYFVKDRVPLQICDYIYPIGAIYMSVTNVSPAILFGGTWERIEDKFLLAAGSTYTVNSTGGEAEHILSAAEMPAHGHNIRVWNTASASGVWKYWTNNGTTLENNPYGLRGAFNATWTTGNQSAAQAGAGDQAGRSDPSGGGQPHNNMPPYLVVNVWMRVPDPVEEEEE